MSIKNRTSGTIAFFVVIGLMLMMFTACFHSETKIKFNSNGGTSFEPIAVEDGTESIELPTPEKEGYDFEGWYSDRSCTKRVYSPLAGDDIPASSVTYYAKWSVKYVTVTFTAGGNKVEEMRVSYGTIITPSEFPSLEKYPGYEWVAEEFKATYDRQFTAKVKEAEKAKYKVVYYLPEKGEKGETVFSVYKEYEGYEGTKIGSPLKPINTEMESDSYFAYWYALDENGEEVPYDILPTSIGGSNIALYAKFIAIGDDSKYLYYEKTEDGIIITGMTLIGSYQTSLSIPSQIDGEDVISIGKNEPFTGKGAFTSDFLETVIIPKTATVIADWAFFDCDKLSNIVFVGNEIPKIGKGSFAGCVSLKEVDFPDYLTGIEDYAFAGISLKNGEAAERFGITEESGYADFEWKTADMALTSANFGVNSKLSTIGDYAFYGCSSLKAIRLSSVMNTFNYLAFSGSGVEDISFYDGGALTGKDGAVISSNGRILYYYPQNAEIKLMIPDGVTTINDNAFNGNKKITAVTVPSTVTALGNGAFGGCSTLSAVNLEATSVKTVGNGAFYECISLSGISLPVTVTEIGEYAFAGCTSLSAVNFYGDAVKEIKDYAFYGCFSLSGIIVSKDVTRIGDYAFYGCSGMGMLVFDGAETLTEIGDYAFANCVTLASVTLPSSIQSIGAYAFAGTDGNKMNFEISDETMLDKVERYGEYAFANTSITKFTFSGRIVSDEAFGKYLFYMCRSLKKISFTQTSNYSTIPEGLFYGCAGILDVTFTQNIETVEKCAFYGCTGLVSVNLRNVETIKESAFENCTALTGVTLPSTLRDIGKRAFFNCESIETITVPAKITELKEETFAGCSSLGLLESSGVKGIAYENGALLETIGENCFAYCTSLKTATLPKKLLLRDTADTQGMVKNPFIGCTSLTAFEFDRMATGERTENGLYIENGAVYKTLYRKNNGKEAEDEYAIYAYPTSKSKNVEEIGAYVSEIDRYAFYGSSITGLLFMRNSEVNGIESIMLLNIGDYAFALSNVKEVLVSQRVYRIGEHAFDKSSVLDVKYENDDALIAKGNQDFNILNACGNDVDGNVPENNRLTIGAYAFANIGISTFVSKARTAEIQSGALSNNFQLASVTFESGEDLIIGDYAFANNNLISEITVPESVDRIGNGAFYRCSNLKTFKFLHSTQEVYIGDYAFAEMQYLYEISLPDNLVYLGKGVFEGDTRLKYINFGSEEKRTAGAIVLPEEMLVGVNTIESMYIPSYVSEIGKRAFAQTNISEVTFSEAGGNLIIGDGAFFGMKNLKSVILPDRVVSIGAEAFAESALNEIVFSNKGKTMNIGDKAFYLTYLTEIHLGSRISSIGKGVFSDIKTLTSFSAVGGITEIPEEGFMNCSALKTVNIDGNVKKIGKRAFYNCGLERIEGTGIYCVCEEAFTYSLIKSAVIGNDACDHDAEIESRAFYGADKLVSVSIGTNKNISIGKFAFTGCIMLNELSIKGAKAEIAPGFAAGAGNLGEGFVLTETADDGNYYYDTEEKVVFSKDKTTFVFYPSGKKGSNFVLGSTVDEIGDYAFYGSSGLTGIIIDYDGENVIARGENSFTSANGGLMIYVGKKMVDLYKNEWAMDNIKPNEVTAEGFVLERQNSGKYTIIDYLGEDRDIVINGQIIGEVEETVDGKTVTKQIKYEVVGISENAFGNNIFINSVVIGNGIKSVGTGAFRNCVNLKSVVISETVTGIKSYAFYNCKSLKEVVFHSDGSLINIGNYAFFGCESLKSIEIPAGVEQIGIFAFSDAKSLKTVIINDGVEFIGSNVFENCVNLINITFPATLKTMGSYLFGGCERLIYIKFNGETVPTIEETTFAGVINSLYFFVPTVAEQAYKIDIMWRKHISKILSAEDVCSVEGYEKYVIKEITDGYELVAFIGTDNYEDRHITIKSNIGDGINIVSIGEYAIGQFVESLTIEEGVKTIANRAFYYAANLQSVTLPASLEKIGGYAFIELDGLRKVEISDYSESKLTSIGEYAFYDCTGLTEFVYPQSLKTIGAYAFGSDDKMNLKDIRFLHNNCQDSSEVWISIGEYAFKNNIYLRIISFDCLLKSLGEGAFYGCEMLDIIFLNYGQGMTTGYLATALTDGATQTFEKCNKLSIVVPSVNVANLYNRNWDNSYDKNRITESKYVKTYEKYDEHGNPYIDYRIIFRITDMNARYVTIMNFVNGEKEKPEIEFPSGVEIEGYTYTVVRIGRDKDGDVTRINGYVIPYSAKKIIIPNTVKIIGEDAFRNSGSLESVEIKESTVVGSTNGLATIEAYAFYGCEKLTDITIPATLKTMEEDAFGGCVSLNKGLVIKTPSNDNLDLTINARAFENCIGMTEFVLPRHVKELGNYAFYGCSSLGKFTFAEDSRTSIIGEYAFAYTKIKEIKFPAVVESVGDYAMAYCTELNEVYLERELSSTVKQLTYTSGNVFAGIADPHLKVYVPDSAYTTYVVSDGWKTKTVIKNVISKDKRFAYTVNDAKTAVTITAYRGNEKVLTVPREIYVDDMAVPVTTLSKYFANSSVEKIIFEKKKSAEEVGLSNIEAYAFSGCTALKEIHIPDTVIFIDDFAFENCTSLTDITLPAELTAIEDYLFYGCIALNEIRIPSKVHTFGNASFTNCVNLERMIVEYANTENIPVMGTGTFKNAGTATKVGLKIIVPDRIVGACISNWRDVSDRIYSEVNLVGDYLFEYNATGNAFRLIQYLGNAEELDLTELTFMGYKVAEIAENSIKNDDTVLIIDNQTVYPESMKDKVIVKTE